MLSTKRRKRLFTVLGCIGLFFVSSLLLPAQGLLDSGSPSRACLTNLRMNYLALSFYTADHDGSLPLRDAWMDSVMSYSKGEPQHCTEVKEKGLFGYAFNSLLSGGSLSGKAEDRQPLVYDSINFARNASDPFNSLPAIGRHGGRNAVIYTDGHGRTMPGAP